MIAGLLANPAAGKDIRRLVTHASQTSDAEKVAQLARAAVGAIAGGADLVLCADDKHGIARRAADEVDAPDRIEMLDVTPVGRAVDTARALTEMRRRGVGAVVALGGDGTQRDVALAWPDCPLVALSTGTNNVFPQRLEATTAGEAAGAVAAGRVDLGRVAERAKMLRVRIGDDEEIALVDVARLTHEFVGARAVVDAGTVTHVVACIADPSAVGISAIAARLAPIDRAAEGATAVELGAGQSVRVPLAPGHYVDLVGSASHVRERDDRSVVLEGPCVLAFDGERDRVLDRDEVAHVTVSRDGPWVIDPAAVMMHIFDNERGRC